MTKLVWDLPASRAYESGVDRGVFYPKNAPGVAWNGLLQITENAEGGELAPNYLDGIKYMNELAIESYSAALVAFTYPDSFTKNGDASFHLSYRTQTETGFKIHLVYNVRAKDTDISHSSINPQSTLETFTWNLSTSPIKIRRGYPSAHLIIDSRYTYAGVIDALENLIYGSPVTDPRMPTLVEVQDLFDSFALMTITDHGDGTYTASGPDSMVYMLDATSYEINSPSVLMLDAETYEVTNW